MYCRMLTIVFLLVVSAPAVSATTSDQQVVTMDENLWVAFYDLPSRRFRSARTAFIRREFAQAAHDLDTSSVYLSIEADRALPAISTRLNTVADRILWISGNTEDVSVTAADLDALFSQAHWLLAQHYLDLAKRSRDSGQHRNAGLNLYATTHHLERAVLWSNSRITRDVHKTLESLRDLADQLQDKAQAPQAYREKPIVKAEKLLRKLGNTIELPGVLPAAEVMGSFYCISRARRCREAHLPQECR